MNATVLAPEAPPQSPTFVFHMQGGGSITVEAAPEVDRTGDVESFTDEQVRLACESLITAQADATGLLTAAGIPFRAEIFGFHVGSVYVRPVDVPAFIDGFQS